MKSLFPLLIFCLLASVAAIARAERPNVLLIVCDDLNNHVSTSGYQTFKTPGLEKLAAAGMTFDRAYCQYPVCGPSRASFLSGLYPESTGILDNKLDIRDVRAGTMSLPQVFKHNGYWTAGVGKVFHNTKADQGEIAWHEVLRFSNEENPIERKLRTAYEAEYGPIQDEDDRSWRRHLKDHRSELAGQTPPGYGPTQMRDEQHKDGKNVRQVAKWLDDKVYADKPFFHRVWYPETACAILGSTEIFRPASAERDQVSSDSRRTTGRTGPRWQSPSGTKRLASNCRKDNDELRREYMQAYHACISFIDAQISLALRFTTAQRPLGGHDYHLHLRPRLSPGRAFNVGQGDAIRGMCAGADDRPRARPNEIRLQE